MERSDLGSPFGRAGCPVWGRLRGSGVPMDASQSSNGVPSQSACSADSSPKGRAKGAAAPVRFQMLRPGRGGSYPPVGGCFAAVDCLFPADPATKENPGGFLRLSGGSCPGWLRGVPQPSEIDCGDYLTSGPAETRALPASLPVYLTKFLAKRLARSAALVSQSATLA